MKYAFFMKVRKSYWSGYTAGEISFQSSIARGKKFPEMCTVVNCQPSIYIYIAARMTLLSLIESMSKIQK